MPRPATYQWVSLMNEFDSQQAVLRSAPERLSAVLHAADGQGRLWQPSELAAIFKHQMSAPVGVDLGVVGPALSGKLRVLCDAEGLLLRSFSDLLHHPAPPLELLELIKDFAKLHRSSAESELPNEIATALYFLSIAASLVRCGKRITRLSDEALNDGFAWLAEQAWLDESGRRLVSEARRILSGGA